MSQPFFRSLVLDASRLYPPGERFACGWPGGVLLLRMGAQSDSLRFRYAAWVDRVVMRLPGPGARA